MARLGFIVGIVVPLILLGVNLVLQYGGILATIALIVWLATAILFAPTAEDEA